MSMIDIEKIGLLAKAFKTCGQIDENCLECPYRKYGWRCIREMNKDAASILATIFELFDAKDRVISSTPDNIDELLQRNKEAWKKYAETLNDERVAALKKENAELRSKLDSIYSERLRELQEEQTKLTNELLYSEMHREAQKLYYGNIKND